MIKRYRYPVVPMTLGNIWENGVHQGQYVGFSHPSHG